MHVSTIYRIQLCFGPCSYDIRELQSLLSYIFREKFVVVEIDDYNIFMESQSGLKANFCSSSGVLLISDSWEKIGRVWEIPELC